MIERKHPVHFPPQEQHNTPIIIFVTVCTKDRKQILANETAHAVLLNSWDAADGWMIGRYMIMPDHLHLFCAPAELASPSLQRWVDYWKSNAARNWPDLTEAPIWQRDFWDTQLRRTENYDQKWEYFLQNPVRAGLVEEAKDWPYQGELRRLQW